MIDLTKNRSQFNKYTLKKTLSTELLLEDHLSDLIALEKFSGDVGKLKKKLVEILWCRECVTNHALELLGFCSEAITGGCPNRPAWEELSITADEIYEFFEPLKRIEQYTKPVFEKARQFNFSIRAIRKKLENRSPARLEYIGVKSGDNGNEYIR
ncbi:unnamed protein product [marine sediment metagenome]|uniref:Uncharacterized protein n=1 Tax=marine sediment metagenome TaxID=412755 RepID=X1VFK6_9ZZZZ